MSGKCGSWHQILILLTAIFLLTMPASAQTTLVVNKTSPTCTAGDAYYTTIQSAIDAAGSGSTVLVCPGIYNENVDVTKSLTIKSFSQNPSDTIVQAANPNDHVFNVAANSVNISGFTIKGATNYTSGIYIDKANGTSISDNLISQNFGGIRSSQDYPFSNTRIINNTVTSSTNRDIFLHRADYAIISDNHIVSNNNIQGILGMYLSNSIIENNNISGETQLAAIWVSYSTNISIIDNTISLDNIWLHDTHNTLIAHNKIVSGTPVTSGMIRLTGFSYYNTILNNSIRSGTGILLITGYSGAPSNNTIKNNSVVNSYYGITLYNEGYANKPKDNKIYHNNLINNTIQASDVGTNKWDDGYYKGGNYLSSWTVPDNLKGVYQNESGSDGIVDYPSNISGGTNKDRYPFAKLSGWLDFGAKFYLPSGTPRMNTTITIPINFSTTMPVGSAQLYLLYNSSVINATNVTAGSSSQGVLFSSRINNSEGKITIVVVSVDGISTAGSLADIEFRVIGPVNSSTTLRLVSEGVTDAKNIELNVILNDGTLTVISYPTGDVTGDNEITVADALMYLRFAAGEPVENVNPLHDVTCDGRITAADALLVLRKAVGQEVSLEC